MEKIEGTTRNSMAYELEPNEVGILILGMKREISRERKKIEKIDMDPRNEGQVTFLERKEKSLFYIKELEQNIKTLTKDRDLYLAAKTRDPEKLQEVIKKHQETK